MKKIIILLGVFISLWLNAQVSPPVLSADSGFYENEFTLTISHSDPNAVIIYTTDGSDPHLDNIGGVTYNYKVSYPGSPGEPFGSLLQNSFETLTYQNPLLIEDRSNAPNKTSAIPTTFFSSPYIPQSPVFKGTVIKARAVVGSEYSGIIVRNYYVTPQGADRYTLPVISLNIDEDKYYSYEYGLNVAGIVFDQWRTDNPTAPFDIWADANYWASGSESELQLNFSYMENGTEILSHDAGIRNHGNGSRHMSNRSIRLYAKNGYGVSRFNHSFFNDYDYDSFKRIILRNSGNDAGKTMFRDAFIQQMVKHMNFEIQDYQPVILFVNSEYSGIYNVRERYDEHYFDRVFGIDEDEVDFMEFANEALVDVGDSVHYDSMMNYLENNSLSDDTNFEYVTTLVDIENYTDYYIANIFSDNYDWPHNNNEFFRKRVTFNPNAPYGQDGRWRWVLKDMDFGFNLFEVNGNTFNTLAQATKFYESWEWNAEVFNESTLLMRRLLENEEYKNYFINRFADMLNTTFLSSRVVSLIDEMKSIIDPEIEEHIDRWAMIPTYNAWNSNINVMKTFAQSRPNIQRSHILQKFDIDNIFEVVADVSNENHGYVTINTIEILPGTVGVPENPYPWTGTYFEEIPVTITAIPNEGYVFSHWEGTESGTDPELVVSMTGSIYAKAVFISEDESNVDYQQSFEVKVYPNPFDDKIYLISEEYGFEYSLFTLDGKRVKNGIMNNATLYLNELQAGIYFLKLKTVEEEITHKIIKR